MKLDNAQTRPRFEVARPYVGEFDPEGRDLTVHLDDDHAWGVIVTHDGPPAFLRPPPPESGLPSGVLVAEPRRNLATFDGPVIVTPEWRVDIDLSTTEPRRRTLVTRADPFQDWSDPTELVVLPEARPLASSVAGPWATAAGERP